MDPIQTGMQSRSSVTTQEKENENEKIQKISKESLPFIEFTGSVVYTRDIIGFLLTARKLLLEAVNYKGIMVVGFDMEWPYSYETGPGKTALIQISPNLDMTYLLHVSKTKDLPTPLFVFMGHPNVRLTGNNIKNDIMKLAQDFYVFNVEEIIRNCIDSALFANEILPYKRNWSLAFLVEYLLQKRISKDDKERMSQWDKIPLTPAQIKYAATDSYASLSVYLKLEQLKNDPSLIAKLPRISYR